MDTVQWTLAEANNLIDRISGLFTNEGLQCRVVGGVARHGYSENDLDLLLIPASPMDLSVGIERLGRLLPTLEASDMRLNPTPDGTQWFANVLLPDDRVVEFYFPLVDFPED